MVVHAKSASVSAPAEPLGDALPVGTALLRGQYKIEKFLNAGGFGISYLARDSLDRQVVIKECFPAFLCYRNGSDVAVRSKNHIRDYAALVDLFRAEARALAGLDHPNIVGVHEIFDDNNTSYMALDFVEGKDLQQIVENDPERLGPHELSHILVTLLGAVSYIHERGVLHRDISPDNILIDSRNVPVLIDFGSARQGSKTIRGAETRLQSVKDGYSPQEFYARKMPHSAASDLYALGATFHFAIRGEAPPASQYRVAAIVENKADPYRPLKGEVRRFDDRMLESIDRSLAVVSKNRPQSAREWLLAIDDESRKVAAFEKARNDERIEQIVRDLVISTNSALQEQEEQDKLAEAARAERAAKMAEMPKTTVKLTLDQLVEADIERERRNTIVPAERQGAKMIEPRRPVKEAGGRTAIDRISEDAASPWISESQRSVMSTAQEFASTASRVVDAEKTTPAKPRSKQRRRSLKINWVLPPLFVSNAAQIAGKAD